MKKYFDNERGVGAVSVLILLIAYIFVLSLVLSFFIVNIYGSDVSHLDLPTAGQIKIFNQEQNFQNGSYDLETIGKMQGGHWTYINGVGYQLDGFGSSGVYSYLVIDNLEPDSNNLYQNSYWINNSATDIFGKHPDYCILLRGTGGADQNEICVTNDGFNIPHSFVDKLLGNDFSYPYSGASQITEASIKTIYNDKTPSVEFYFNGNKIFQTTQLHLDSNILGVFGRYYAGVGASSLGLVFEDFKTDNLVIFNKDLNVIQFLSAMTNTILKISTWQIPDWILPLFFVQIFITLPEGLIVILIAIIVFRGVG